MNNNRPNTLYLVVPCYNEEEALPHSAQVMREKLNRLMQEGKASPESKILLVNDGSRDKTWQLIHGLCDTDPTFAGLSFSRNYGHQSAILAGMMAARQHADIAVTIDADLQQDIEALDQFLEKYQAGCEIVYGIRNDRNADGFFKKLTANGFYGLMHLLGCNVMSNHADYRLLSKKALDALSEYKEVNLFLRGLIPTMGFPSDVVYFDVKEREAGTSKYTLRKMMNLATDGITSMSTRPIQLISMLGFAVSVFSVIMIIYCIAEWAMGRNVPGYTTTLVVSLLMGGLTIFSLGIVGEYVGKIYLEAKARPRYIVESFIWKEGNCENFEREKQRK
ncbi:MAG TPA: glycosyltransferase family 2 protein [Candidatus Eisenbergiella pullistercoris]|uniref:Glycosyltransferase family 2 protein n=1 Tax=Candidatus Eisenbergiella pullistercoris TaxID=2838555 RepID=A0A9D1YNY5_9FIRM|nr:glycosyltransferase family 2 protein [Candidatus Eisenbergiella pullistercoris]